MVNRRPDAERMGLADLHAHTYHSDGRDSPRRMVDAACRAGLDLIAITDHDTIEGALRATEYAEASVCGVAVIVGEEVSSRDGHILGLFLERRVLPGLSAQDTIALIQAQGGLAIAAHPFWQVERGQSQARSVGELIESLPFDAVEVVNGGPTPSMWAANRQARQRNARLGRVPLGGSDAHVAEAVGWAHTRFPGHSPEDLRTAVRAGSTLPVTRPLGLLGLTRYLAWSMKLHRHELAAATG